MAAYRIHLAREEEFEPWEEAEDSFHSDHHFVCQADHRQLEEGAKETRHSRGKRVQVEEHNDFGNRAEDIYPYLGAVARVCSHHNHDEVADSPYNLWVTEAF